MAEKPKHLAIIMDGNGRWAIKKGLKRIEGHKKGIQALKTIIKTTISHKIPNLTVFAFSRENWQRPRVEVNALMLLFLDALDKQKNFLTDNNICLKIIGDKTRLEPKLTNKITKIEDKTAAGTDLKLKIAIDYSAKWELTQLFYQAKKYDIINENVLEQAASYLDMIPVDLLIRTGGEYRLSNFMFWQIAYAELYFTDTLWPDFDDNSYNKALNSYHLRSRRFGKIVEQ